MAELISFVDSEFSTDFGLLHARQEGVVEEASSMTFAASIPGQVGMSAGTRYANLAVRLERWDAQPPPSEDGWEDLDEVPWVTEPSAGRWQASGFDPAEPGTGLSLEGLERGRLQVMAAGRYRYRYGDDDVDDLPPERWLLRLWPEQARDGLSGPPRRLAGRLPFANPTNAWFNAVHSWSAGGWSHYFLGIEALRNLEIAMLLARQPTMPDDLMARLARMYPQDALGWASPALRRMPTVPGHLARAREQERWPPWLP